MYLITTTIINNNIFYKINVRFDNAVLIKATYMIYHIRYIGVI